MLWFVHDLRMAIRSTSRHWIFAVAVVLLLALGASVAIVMLSFAEAVLFRSLAAPRPAELVGVVQDLPRVGIMSSLPEAYYENLRAQTGAFALLQPMLFNTSPTSPVTALVTATVVLIATLVATAGPIARVAKLPLAQVLRD